MVDTEGFYYFNSHGTKALTMITEKHHFHPWDQLTVHITPEKIAILERDGLVERYTWREQDLSLIATLHERSQQRATS
tara:strand:- start:530 stop:763 length:234 start_codon:yes stop_codon:yes gene_type:complete